MCRRGGASGDASGLATARGAFAEGLPRAPEASRDSSSMLFPFLFWGRLIDTGCYKNGTL